MSEPPDDVVSPDVVDMFESVPSDAESATSVDDVLDVVVDAFDVVVDVCDVVVEAFDVVVDACDVVVDV